MPSHQHHHHHHRQRLRRQAPTTIVTCSRRIHTCVCSLVLITSMGVVKKEAVVADAPPKASCGTSTWEISTRLHKQEVEATSAAVAGGLLPFAGWRGCRRRRR
eukprot:scaffold1707_cov357-Prasinococcus_capsulatus_cf.AAC.7